MNKPFGEMKKFSDPNSGATAFLISLIMFPILLIIDFILPINLTQFPYILFVILCFFIMGIIIMKRLKHCSDNCLEFEALKSWREKQNNEYLWLLEILTFIVTVLITIGGAPCVKIDFAWKKIIKIFSGVRNLWR
ncbi:MAG: hypothetical protein JEY99_11930, partial [Spirochaetales bacterium]|nr:hypothetical protein [Spirochaetales bacterium]